MRLLPRIAAMFAPILIIGGSLLAIDQVSDPTTTEGRISAAGKVVNGRRLKESVITWMAKELASRDPEVVVLGNSTANTNINMAELANLLDIPPRRLSRMSIPGSVGSHWFAILKNRVYLPGYRPKLVIIMAPARALVLNEPYSEAANIDLVVHLNAHEPVIDAKVKRRSVFWGLLRVKRGEVRRRLLDGLRNQAVQWVFGGNSAETERAMGRLFSPGKLDHSRHEGMLPVVETREVDSDADPNTFPMPAASFIPELAALCADYGTKLVLVRPPIAPRTPREERDIIRDGDALRIDRLLSRRGHTFVDLSELELPDGVFPDHHHVDEHGAKTITRLLAGALRESASVIPGPRLAFRRPVAPEITGEPGERPPVGSLVEGLDGWWVNPGDSLRFAFPSWELPPNIFSVQLVAEQFGVAGGPTLTLDGMPLPLAPTLGGRNRARYRVDVSDPPPDGPWSVGIAVAADADPVLLEGLRIGRGPGARQVVGRYPNHLPARFDLLGELELHEGRLVVRALDATFAAPPPALPRSGRKPYVTQRHLAAYRTGDLAPLSDPRTQERTPLHVRCSPVQVLEDDVPIRRRHDLCAMVPRRGKDRMCHNGKQITIGSTDKTHIATGGRTYTLGLDPTRACLGGRWLYPGDRMTMSVPLDVQQHFRDGIGALELTGFTADGRRATLEVRLVARERTVVDDAFTLDGAEPVSNRTPFSGPVWPDAGEGQLILTVGNPTARFVLLTGAVLEGAAPVPHPVLGVPAADPP